ncbi:putative Tetratricopeptide repeat-like superfamily protein [Hibiscus syriacus]|uniref:Tetratricopeptide repeat-like superfamily protein n=1 Tax=Hibiscus syriacus TaxID=106335 RepID=A0A6A3ASZ0_HIBSY|nr:putative Tetratricopeptide repeat-like superfamily protein [Hibiscus syriacus]
MPAVLEEFEPIFGQPKVEWTGSNSGLGQSSEFVFYLHSPDPSHLRICVTDFRDATWESVRSVSQLDDMRDSVGIGGSWSDFIHYILASVKSEDVKLLLEALPDSNDTKSAKLVAQKSKGMPRISFSLTKLTASAASDAMANLSLELFKAFKGLQHLFIQDRWTSAYPSGSRCVFKSAYAEKNETIQSQLELNSKRQKLQKTMNSLDKADVSAPGQSSPDKHAAQDPSPAKVTKRAVPARRRAKVRGVVLQDSENEKDG